MLKARNLLVFTFLMATSPIAASPAENYEADALGITPSDFINLATYYGIINCSVDDTFAICDTEDGRMANVELTRQVRRVTENFDVLQRSNFYDSHPDLLILSSSPIWDCKGDLDCEISVLTQATSAWAELGSFPGGGNNIQPDGAGLLVASEKARKVPVRKAANPLRFEPGKKFTKLERDIREKSDAAKTIYKAPRFWYQFDNPGLMKRVFEGNGVFGLSGGGLIAGDLSLDRPEVGLLIQGWAISFDQYCMNDLPAGSAEWTTTFPNKEVRKLRIHPNFRNTVQAHIDHQSSFAGRAMEKSGEISQAMDYLSRIQRGEDMFGTAINMTAQSLSPVTDVDILIHDHGCMTPIAIQFRENLSRIALGESTLQEAGIGIKGFEDISDEPPK